MAEFTHELSEQLLAACQSGSEDAAEALGRALDGDFTVTVEVGQPPEADALPDAWQGPGLSIFFEVGDAGALLLLPESPGLLPQWYAEPDDTGKSKLATLAQELGLVLFPEGFEPAESRAERVADLAAEFSRHQPPATLGALSLTLACGENLGVASFVWPLQKPTPAGDQASGEGSSEPLSHSDRPADEEPAESTSAHPDSSEPAGDEPRKQVAYADLEDGIAQLPSYARSLLKVRVPVTVTLATARKPIQQILELGPGSILQFDKSCDDTLTLDIGDQTIAEGEAVKVGDKFGIWVTGMKMPGERFWSVNGERRGGRVK